MAFKIHYGYCKFCDKDDQLIVVKSGYCQQCNYKQKQAKKKLEGKKTGGYKYVREATGERSVFEDVLDSITDSEETKCFVCGCRIAVVTHSNFSHILSKGRYPKFRLNPNNIRLMCFRMIAAPDEYGQMSNGCHNDYDFKPHSELNPLKWEKVFQLKAQLLEEYKRIKE